MRKPFDVSPKSISDAFPDPWFLLLKWPFKSIEIVDADVATVSGAADKVYRINGVKPWMAAFEFRSTYKEFVPERLHWHSSLISHRHQLLVRSVVILLRPEADGPMMTGEYHEAFDNEEPHLIFRYRILRLWTIPAEILLEKGLGLALFAPLGKLEPERLIDVVRKARKRVHKERDQDAPDLVAAMYILMGLRYDSAMIESIKKEVSEMEESITYQEIIKKGEARGEARGKAEGRLEEARQFVVLMGTEQLGQPNAAVLRKLHGIDDLSRLHQLGLHVRKVRSWKDLLAVK